MLKNQYSSYQNNNLPSGNIHQLIALYNGMINHLQKAKLALEQKDYQEKFNRLDKAVQIVLGLRNAIDFNKGQDIGKALDVFYSHIYMEMISLHHKNDLSLYDKIISQLSEMLDAWYHVEKELGKEKALK